MARWKLMNSHYLNTVDPAEWEYSENSRTTGKPVRRKFHVPRLLDPREPSDWTNTWGARDNAEGEIVVCQPGKGQERDIEFLGDPTPDMMPLDDEAKAISLSFEKHWRFKPETSEASFSQSLVDGFQEEMSKIEARPTAPVQVEGLADLITVLAAQAKATQDLIASQSSQRRV